MYFYNARYYDATIGRFISPDSIVPGVVNPQAWNRYTYCLNNPLRYNDFSGHGGPWDIVTKPLEIIIDAGGRVLDTGKDIALKPLETTVDLASTVVDAVIPEGNTVGIGINVNLGLGGGVSFGGMIVADGSGGIGVCWSGGGGGYGGLGGSITPQVQWTTANTIEQLRGPTALVGASGDLGLSVGAEYVVGEGYQGTNINVGIGLNGPVPFEEHGFLEFSGVHVITSGNYQPTPSDVIQQTRQVSSPWSPSNLPSQPAVGVFYEGWSYSYGRHQWSPAMRSN